MTLGNVQPGDIVLVDHNGRQALAEVTGRADGGLHVRPLARSFTWRVAASRDVVGIWRATKATREAGVRPHA